MKAQKITKEILENLPINKNYAVFGKDKILLELIYINANHNICAATHNEALTIQEYLDSFIDIDEYEKDDYKNCYIQRLNEIKLEEEQFGSMILVDKIEKDDIACHINNWRQGLAFFIKVSYEDVVDQHGQYIKLIEYKSNE